jgi:hypothetical protein
MTSVTLAITPSPTNPTLVVNAAAPVISCAREQCAIAARQRLQRDLKLRPPAAAGSRESYPVKAMALCLDLRLLLLPLRGE